MARIKRLIVRLFKGTVIDVVMAAIALVARELRDEITESKRDDANKAAMQGGVDLVEARIKEVLSKRL